MAKLKISILLLFLFLVLAFPQNIYAEDKSAGSSAMLAPVSIPVVGNRRVRVLKKFLLSYNSELAPFAESFVKQADKNYIDWRLLVAVSGVESTFAHFQPNNSHNSWGFGIYGNQVKYFKSYDEAIEIISKTIRDDYIDKWKSKDVYDIGRYYAASPTWPSRVAYFMAKIDEVASKLTSDDLSLSL